MRKAARAVELDDILSTEFFGDSEPLVGIVVRTHLALEACLVELAQTAGHGEAVWKWSFPKKTEFLVNQGLLLASDKEAFDKYNDLRNDFAHISGHTVGLPQLLALARELERLGVDFSDSVGHYSEAEATQFYDGIVGVAAEMSWCVLFHAAYILMEKGGRDIFSA